MNSDTMNQVSNEVKSALTEILPDLHSVLKNYQISRTLDITLVDLASTGSMDRATCCFHGGRMRCACTSAYGISVNEGDLFGLNPEQAEQFCKEVASKLNAILPQLRQTARQADPHFEVGFRIDPRTAGSGQPVRCKWSSSGGNILECSSS